MTFAVKIGGDVVSNINTVSYGDTVQITATASKPITRAGRSIEVNKVDFYIGETSLGTTDVFNNVATLDVMLDGETWNKGFRLGDNTIKADFGGPSDLMVATTVTKETDGTLTVSYDYPKTNVQGQTAAPSFENITYTMQNSTGGSSGDDGDNSNNSNRVIPPLFAIVQ